jgi:hypothetical protein
MAAHSSGDGRAADVQSIAKPPKQIAESRIRPIHDPPPHAAGGRQKSQSSAATENRGVPGSNPGLATYQGARQCLLFTDVANPTLTLPGR